MSDFTKRSIAVSLIDAIKHIHSMNFAHRDIKSPNVFVTKDFQYRLGDFGFTDHIKRIRFNKDYYCGTNAYFSPEIIGNL